MATVLERVQKVVVERLGAEESAVVPEAAFTDDLSADSLDLVELIMAFEEEFTESGATLEEFTETELDMFTEGGVVLKISDKDAESIRTIDDAVTFIKGKGFSD